MPAETQTSLNRVVARKASPKSVYAFAQLVPSPTPVALPFTYKISERVATIVLPIESLESGTRFNVEGAKEYPSFTKLTVPDQLAGSSTRKLPSTSLVASPPPLERLILTSPNPTPN